MTKTKAEGDPKVLLGRIKRLLKVRCGVDTMSRRMWGKELAELIVGLAATGISPRAVESHLPGSLVRAFQRERSRRAYA
jgi:hypothetical protein